jgi:hypothetical protein
LNFLIDINLKIGEGCRSNKFELRFGIFGNLIRIQNQGIWKFDEANSNSDLEFGFKRKRNLAYFRTSKLDLAQEKNYAFNAILANFS